MTSSTDLHEGGEDAQLQGALRVGVHPEVGLDDHVRGGRRRRCVRRHQQRVRRQLIPRVRALAHEHDADLQYP